MMSNTIGVQPADVAEEDGLQRGRNSGLDDEHLVPQASAVDLNLE